MIFSLVGSATHIYTQIGKKCVHIFSFARTDVHVCVCMNKLMCVNLSLYRNFFAPTSRIERDMSERKNKEFHTIKHPSSVVLILDCMRACTNHHFSMYTETCNSKRKSNKVHVWLWSSQNWGIEHTRTEQSSTTYTKHIRIYMNERARAKVLSISLSLLVCVLSRGAIATETKIQRMNKKRVIAISTTGIQYIPYTYTKSRFRWILEQSMRSRCHVAFSRRRCILREPEVS